MCEAHITRIQSWNAVVKYFRCHTFLKDELPVLSREAVST